MSQQVLPFHIAMSTRASGGTYMVHASTKGAATTTELELPATLLALASRLLKPGVELPVSDAQALGRALGQALLAPPLRDMLLRSARSVAQDAGRLQVQLQIAAPELAALPWEWMTLGVSRPWSPALRDDYALVRVGRRAPLPAAATVAGPLRVLAVASTNETLQLEALHSALAPAVHAGLIELHMLRDVTPQSLEVAIRRDAPHILHCAAPVSFTPNGAPQLMVGRGLAAFDLATLAAESPNLRLITLAGQQGDAGAVSVAPTLLATTLVSDDLPAAIAFGSALPALLGARFAATCYWRLAEGVPADLAVTAGRRALAEHANGRGWGFPQLRLLPGGELLFAFSGARSARRAARRTRPARARANSSSLRRWALLPGVVALLLVLLFVGRSLSARTNTTASALVGPQASHAAAAPTAALDASTAAAPADGAPAGSPSATASTAMLSVTMPASSTLAVSTPSSAPAGYATILTSAGDTLDSIAGRMGSDAAAIAALNHLDPQQPLRPERPLVIPVFRPGEGGTGGILIDHGNRSRPEVALTFDIEIDDATLYSILDILRARGLHGTFFVTGNWVRAFPDAARAIVRDGHEIANHSLTHPYFSRIGLDGAASELEETERIVQQTTGVTSRPYFRFPYGDSTADTVGIVGSQGYVAYHWSADDSAISSWLDRTAANPKSGYGGILLMHGRPSTVQSLPGWIDRLNAIGLQPATLGEVLK